MTFYKGQKAWNKGTKGIVKAWNKGKKFPERTKKIKLICQICGKEFEVQPCRKNSAKYCSKKCHNIAKKGTAPWNKGLKNAQKGHTPWNKGKCAPKKECICKQCKKIFFIGRWYKGTFCSKKCRSVFYSKESHYDRTGKKFQTSSGYIILHIPAHPRSNSSGYVREHIVKAGEFLGRFLKSQETIHHINGIKSDNNPGNLYLFPSRGAHSSYHNNVRYKNCKKIIRSNLGNIKTII